MCHPPPHNTTRTERAISKKNADLVSVANQQRLGVAAAPQRVRADEELGLIGMMVMMVRVLLKVMMVMIYRVVFWGGLR